MNEEAIPSKPLVISFYSYRGGTGKSTIASNMAVIAAKKYKTIIIDLDLYSPQLTYIFEIKHEKYINDYLRSSLYKPKVNENITGSLEEIICSSHGPSFIGN